MATFRVSTKNYPESSLNVSTGKVIDLANHNPKNPSQQWYLKTVNQGFALVNKATNMAMEYVGYGEPVQLSPFDPTRVPDTQKWTKGPIVVDNYYPIYSVNDRELVLDAEDTTSIKTSGWSASYDQLWTTKVNSN